MYQRFREQMSAGGDTVDQTDGEQAKNGRTSGIVVAALFVWLGFSNPWILVFVIGLLISIFLHELGVYF
jgi:hypothetical protein